MSKKTVVITILCWFASAFSVSASTNNQRVTNERHQPYITASKSQPPALQVAVSFSILADIVSNIGGNLVNVHSIVGNNQDIHTYWLTPSDIKLINCSKLFIVNGLGLEAQFIKPLANNYYHGKIITASAGVKPIYSTRNNQLSIDPHAFLSINNIVNYYVPNILTALSNADPLHQQIYRINAKKYISQLENTQHFVTNKLASIPSNQRVLVTTHDAFNYFARDYDIKIYALQGLSTDTEPSIKDVIALENIITQRKAKVVFFENMNNNKLIKQIAHDTGVKIGGALYADSLSSASAEANSYIHLIMYDVNNFVQASQ